MANDFMSKYVKEGTKKIKKVPVKSNSWVMNALRSVGYSSMDILSDLMPSTFDTAKTTATLGKDIADTIRAQRSSDRTLKTAIERNYYMGLGKDILKNSFEDLKTGKFYNKERTDKLFDDMNDMGDFDFGDFGDEDFDSMEDSFDDSIESSDGMTRASFSRKKGGNAEVTNIVMDTNLGEDSAMYAVTEFQTETMVNVGRATIDNSRVQNRAMMTMIGGMRIEVSTSLTTISDNISSISSVVSETLSKHATLSSKYYEDSISLQTQILEHLKSGVIQGDPTSTNTRKFREYNNVLDLVSSGGVIDAKGYLNLVKKQANSYIDNNMFLSQLKFMNENRDSMQLIAASPLQKMMTGAIQSMIPKIMQNAMTNFDKQLKETGVAALNQVSGLQRSNNPILSALGSIFGLQNKITLSRVDKSAYNKGAVSWAGTDHQALTNVIPTLLRKIYASISGTQEQVFDYENGIFRNLSDVEKEASQKQKFIETSGYSDFKSQFKEFLDKFAMGNDEKKTYATDFETFIGKLVRDSNGGRTFRLGGRDGKQVDANGETLDDIKALLGPSANEDNVKMIRAFFEMMEQKDKAGLTNFFGNQLQEQRAYYDRQMREMQSDPIKYNTMYLNTGLSGKQKTDSHLYHNDKNDPSRVTGVKSGLAAGSVDKYGKNQNYYLREILNTLTTGIYVIPIDKSTTVNNNNDGGEGDENSNNGIFSSISGRRQSVLDTFRRDKKKSSEKRQSEIKKSTYNDEKKQKDIDRGLIDPESEMSQETLTTLARGDASADSVGENDEKKTFIGKLLDKIPEDSGLGKIIQNIKNKRANAGEKGASVFNTLNNALFEVVFGDGEGKKGFTSIFNKAMGTLKAGFFSFATFLDNKIFKPLNEALFGEEGLVNKIKNTEFGKKLSEIFSNLKGNISSFLLGEKDGDGNRTGGLFSEVANSLKDMGSNVKSAILGEKGPDGKPLPLDQDNSVLGNMKRMFSDVTGRVKDSLGIDKDNNEPLSTKVSRVFNDVGTRIKERASEWSDNLFGQKDENGDRLNSVLNTEFANQFKEDLKGQKGFIGASAGIGALASFFLPGGPIGGALVGTGLGIISKSTGLQELLFGPKDAEGNRLGGLISKEFQDLFTNNKTGLAIGATAGLASSFGLLPSFFLPGGPIGGAVIGGAVSLVAKSGAFSELMFGPDGTEDNPTGGLSKKIKEIFGKDKNLKNVGLDAGIGAGVGVLGSFFLPGGPIIGALLGSAISVGTATDKFKNWFFGEEGEDGKRQGGMLGRFTGFMKEKVFSPLATSVKLAQSHILEFVQTNMVIPFKYALQPLVAEAKYIGGAIKEKVTGLFDGVKKSFENRVVKPIGETVEKYFLNPMKKMLTSLFSGLGKIVGGIISAPFKMFNAAGMSAYEKQKKRGKDAYKSDVNTKFNPFNKENRDENGGGVKGFFKTAGKWIKGRTDIGALNEAQYSDKGAYYDAKNEVKLPDRMKQAIADEKARRENERLLIKSGVKPTYSNSSTKEYKPDKTSTSTSSVEVGETKTQSTSSFTPPKNKKERKRTKEAARQKANRKTSTISTNTTESSYKSQKVENVNTKDTSGRSKVSTTETYEPPKSSSINTKDTYKPPKEKGVKDEGLGSKNVSKLIQQIQKDTSRISDSVYGQMNGVGSNINKIYRLLLKQFGKKDDDIKGDNNKEYVGFFGRIRTALNNPLKAIGNVITAPFRKISDAAHSFVRRITNIGGVIKSVGSTLLTGVKTVSKGILQGAWELIKGLGSVGVELAKVPIDLVRTGLAGIRAILPAVGEALKTGVAIVGDGIRAAGSVLVNGVKTVGNVISNAASGLGKLIGGAMSGLGSILSTVGLIGKDVVKGMWKGLKGIGRGVMSVVSAPFKLFGKKGGGGGVFGKGPIHVIVDSGTLDKVKRVKLVELIKKIDSKESPLESSRNSSVNTSPTSMPYNLQLFAKSKNNSESENNAGTETTVNTPSVEESTSSAEESTTSLADTLKNTLTDVKNSVKDKLAKTKDSVRSRLKRKDDAERASQVEKGSRESVEARIASEDKADEEASFKGKLISLLGRSADAAEEHKSSFLGVFDIKKGLITAGLLMMAPAIIKLFTKFDIGGLLASIGTGMLEAVEQIGGILGILNNGKEASEQASDVVNGEDTHNKVDKDGNLVVDENGKVVKETTKSNSVVELLTPTRTRINTDTAKFENRKDWTNTSDTAVNFAANRAKKGVKKVRKIYRAGKKAVKTGKSIVKGVKTGGKKVFDYATKKSDFLTTAYVKADDVIKGAKGAAKTKVAGAVKKVAGGAKSKLVNSKAGNLVSSAINTAKKHSDDIITTVYTKGDDLIKATKGKAAAKLGKVAGGAKKALKGAGTKLSKVKPKSFTEVSGKAGGVVKKVSKAGGKLGAAIKKMLEAIDFLVAKFVALGKKFGVKITGSKLGAIITKAKGMLKVSKLGKLVTKIEAFIAKITGKTSAASSTLFLADIGFALYGALEGAVNAGAVFEVKPEDVDAKMRAIAGVFKTLLNTSVGSWVDLVAMIFYELFGYNFIKTLATHVYKLLSNDEDYKDLEKSQDKFTEDYEKNQEDEYNAYVIEEKRNGRTPMSFEEFKASDLVTTRSEYNSKVNKSLAKRAVDGAKKVWNATGGALVKGGKFLGDKASSAGKFLGDKAKSAGKWVSGLFNKKDSKGTKLNTSSGTETRLYDTKGNYYVKNGDTYDYCNSSGTKISTGIPDSEVEGMISDGSLQSKDVKLDKKSSVNTNTDKFIKAGKIMKSVWKISSGNVFTRVSEIANIITGDSESKLTSLKEGGMLGSIKTFFTKKKEKAYYDTQGNYYIKQSNGTYTYYNANGDEIASNIPDEKVQDMLTDGLLVEGEVVKKDGKAKEAVDKITSSISNLWDTAKDTVTNKWDSFKDWISGKSNGSSSSSSSSGGIGGILNFLTGKGGGDDSDSRPSKSGEVLNGMPYYSQNDPKYSGKSYKESKPGMGDGKDNQTIGDRGCGPTAMAMVASKVTGKQYDPSTMAKMAEEGGYSTSAGTLPGYFNAAAKTLGISSRKENADATSLSTSLSDGNSVILQGVKSAKNNSPYTSEGHYVTATSVDGDNVVINDPRGKKYSGTYKLSDVLGDTVGMWSFNGKISGKGGSPKSNIFLGGFGKKKNGGGNTFTAEDVVKVAKNEVGYEEKASDKDLDKPHANKGSNNHTKYEKEVFGSSGNYWCASFVSWCFVQAANGDKAKATSVLGSLSMACENIRQSFIKNNRYDKTPQIGDCIFFNGSRHSGANHIAIVVDVKDKTVYTVEGNTSSDSFNDNGGCVAEHKYSVNDSKIMGFGHPKYDGTSNFSGVISSSADAIGDTTTGTAVSADGAASSSPSNFTELLSGAATAFTDSIYKQLGFNTGETTSADGSSTVELDSSVIPASTVDGKGTVEKVWNYFAKAGYSSAATAGILGNLYQESGVNPKAIQSNGKGPAAGIAQWESWRDKDGRWKAMSDYAAKQGKDWTELDPQLEFLESELKSKDIDNRMQGITSPSNLTKVGAKPQSFNEWKKTNDVENATKLFEGAFERAGTPNMPNRINKAKEYYNKYGGGKGGDDGGRPIKPAIGGFGKPKKAKAKVKSVTQSNTSMQGSGSIKVSKAINSGKSARVTSINDTAQLLNTMINYLSQIVDNTGMATTELEALNSKDFSSYNTNMVNSTNNSYNVGKPSDNKKSDSKSADRSKYNMAKRIAAGILS